MNSSSEPARARNPKARTVLCLLLSLFLAGPNRAGGQESEHPHPVAPGIQRERVFLVLMDVVVTDASGRPVNDLRPEEFTLIVDGRTVRIQSVDLQTAGLEAQSAAIPEAPGPVAAPTTPGEARPRAPGPLPPIRRPRGIVLFFDGLDSEIGLGPEPIESARRFLKGGLQEGDEVMVMGLGRECRIYLDFTSDANRALAALEEIEKDPGLRMGGENRFLRNVEEIKELRQASPGGVEAIARMFAEEDRRRASRFTLALQALAEFLRARPGRKEVFLFTDGFPTNPGPLYGIPDPGGVEPGAELDGPNGGSGVSPLTEAAGTSLAIAGREVEAELLQVSQEAASSQVALNTVNTQGLIAAARHTPVEVLERTSTDTLVNVSLHSGGVATHGVNRGFEKPMRTIETQTRSTYLLSYAPEGEPDGKLHSARVLVGRRGVKVRAPEGFFFMTEEQRREKETASAYFAPGLFRKIPLALEAYSYLAADGKPGIDLAIALPAASVLFLPREGHRSARLEGGAVLKSADGKADEPVSRAVEIRLSGREKEDPEGLTLLIHRPLPAGDYEATAVVRDQESGDVGALRVPVKVLPLESDHLAMSSLILSRRAAPERWIDLDPPLGRVPDLGPPTVRRIFTRSDQVTASSIVYHPGKDPATGETRVTAFARIRRGQEVIRQIPSALQRFESAGAPGTLIMKFPLDLSGLEPGLYNLEVEVRDGVERRGVTQHMDFMMR